jgi:hypothetical protein
MPPPRPKKKKTAARGTGAHGCKARGRREQLVPVCYGVEYACAGQKLQIVTFVELRAWQVPDLFHAHRRAPALYAAR